ncbi:hypothetical protein IWX90DRAFT_109717 [Phyllosticta citrichinensis]|uniref:Uncharacterized protein n=1 Tax=Phyllosticta citrichinensis TaxID=1130410 RepID=A0ABR1Y2Y4_9PEZI
MMCANVEFGRRIVRWNGGPGTYASVRSGAGAGRFCRASKEGPVRCVSSVRLLLLLSTYSTPTSPHHGLFHHHLTRCLFRRALTTDGTSRCPALRVPQRRPRIARRLDRLLPTVLYLMDTGQVKFNILSPHQLFLARDHPCATYLSLTASAAQPMAKHLEQKTTFHQFISEDSEKGPSSCVVAVAPFYPSRCSRLYTPMWPASQHTHVLSSLSSSNPCELF